MNKKRIGEVQAEISRARNFNYSISAQAALESVIDVCEELLEYCMQIEQRLEQSVVGTEFEILPHNYELPDTSIDPPCAICGKQPDEHQ